MEAQQKRKVVLVMVLEALLVWIGLDARLPDVNVFCGGGL